ncbi:MAG: hypothetical protein GTN62_04575 [Gemmatimonadales bacterium]|nr:hypothetical protein [Gemmatimonadales bacterium]NIN10613.1 hypothetical protein [Gemmatimonadales bacterium]NIN49375.1 hypothetical protein [Gemmatimonadales bacterium]NIP06839.1 hypothetical protein [Gemmatimonadales bacterium]NIR01513.1 hypothetical protein [Gemmatimonadales bacterium]
MATYQIRSLSLGEILDGAFAIYRTYFATLVSIAIVCEGVPAVMNTYVELGGGPLQHPVMWFAAFVLSGLGGLVAAGATIWVISEVYLGRDPLIGNALGYALGKIVQLFIAGLAKYILVFITSLFFLIPGIIVACGYAVVTQAVVLEKLPSATDALGRSWKLTKGFKGKALVLGIVVFALIMLPLMAAGAFAVFVPGLETTFTVGGQLLQLLLYPIVACAFTLFYYDLRVRKEAFDLEHLSQQLGVEPVEA